MMPKGTLYIVSTPIGNLEDITLRALKTLQEVDLIAAEDTRRTKKLLSHFNISKPLTSYYSHNEKKKSYSIAQRLEEGASVALVSDAGTPGISDPSWHLIKRAVEVGASVLAIPGASAVVSALTVSGLPLDRFVFEGFLPRKKGKRRKRIEQFQQSEMTFVIYESPYRIVKTLEEIASILGNRPVALVRELTKLHEEAIRGDVLEVLEEVKRRKKLGEITLVVGGVPKKSKNIQE